MIRKCAYCGGRGGSREHFWQQWMHDQLGQMPHEMFKVATTSQGDALGRIDHPPERKRLGRQRKHDVERGVCTGCNTGWMNALVQQTKPALEPVLFGQPETVSATDQALIAQWVAMTVMTIEIGQKYPGVQTAEREKFRKDQQVPADWQIWISRYSGTDWSAGYHRHGARAEQADGSEINELTGFVFGCGKACFFVTAGASLTSQFEAALKTNGWRRIYPEETTSIQWDSLVPQTDENLQDLSDVVSAEGEQNAQEVLSQIQNGWKLVGGSDRG